MYGDISRTLKRLAPSHRAWVPGWNGDELKVATVVPKQQGNVQLRTATAS